MLQKRDEFHLPFPCGRRSVDLARARIKPGKEGQGTLAKVLVFDSDGLPRLGCQGRGVACPRLQTGFLVHAQDHFPYAQGAGIQGHNRLDLRRERRIPGDLGRQPQMMAPGFQFVVRQNPLDRLRRDGLYDKLPLLVPLTSSQEPLLQIGLVGQPALLRPAPAA